MIPFLRPSVPPVDTYLHHLRGIDASHTYSNFGPLATRFETRIINELFDGEGLALSVSNATAGLMLALKLLARPRGRYVIMPSFTFAATPLAALWAGFEPYFVDVDADELAADPMLVKNAVAALGDDVAAVMPYSTFGSCIDLLPYEELEDDGVPVIIDAAPTLGSRVERGHFAKGFAGTVV